MKKLTEQWLSTLAYVIVVIGVGLPLWWKTTTVYRAHIPHGEIADLDDISLLQTIHVVLHYRPESMEAAFLQKHIAALNNDVLKYNVTVKSLPSTWLRIVRKHARLDSLFQDEMPVDIPGTIHIVEIPKDAQDIMKGAVIHVSHHRYIAILQEGGAKSEYLLPALAHVIGDRSLRQSLLPKDKRPLRGVQSSATYDLHFCILIPNPELSQKVSWDIQSAITDFLDPFMKKLEDLAEFSTTSQYLYLTPLPLEAHWNEKAKWYSIPVEQLPHAITPIEKHLGSYISLNPGLNFVLYVHPAFGKNFPLQITNSKGDPVSSNAYISPRWGGIHIYNQKDENTSLIPSSQYMAVFVTQLRQFFGLELEDPKWPGVAFQHVNLRHSIRDWEVDSLLRLHTLENLLSTRHSLQSLSQLVRKIGNLVIRDEIGDEIQQSLKSFHEAASPGTSLKESHNASKKASIFGNKAFFDESLLELLYFPDDQKYAIYIPLFLPVGIPVLASVRQLILWIKNKE